MNTNGKWMAGIAAALVTAALLSGCGVSKAKYLEATNSAGQLTAENQKLQTSLTEATAKSAELEKQVGTMQSSIENLNVELEKTKQQTVQMQSTYEGLMGQLKSEISTGQVEVQRMRDGLRVNLAQEILFKSGSANLDKTGKELLGKVAEQLQESKYQVVVIGHTDDQKIGSALMAKYPTNWELGGARAAQIVRLFTEKGITANRLMSVSRGESDPRGDNATPEGRAQNRRIEIRLRPVEVDETAAN